MSPNVGPSTQVLKKFHKLPIEIVTTVLYCCTLHGRELFPIQNDVNQQSCCAIWDSLYSILRVCKLWNYIVMSTPRMWEFVMWSSTKREVYFEPVRIFLKRSRNAFLDVNIELGPGYSSVHYSTFESSGSTKTNAPLDNDPPNPLVLTSFHVNGCWAYSLFDRIDARVLQELHLLGNWISPQAIHCLTQCTALETLDMTTRELRVPDPMTLPSVPASSLHNAKSLIRDSWKTRRAVGVVEGVLQLYYALPPSLPRLLSLTVDSVTSWETLEILYGCPQLKRLHLHGTANLSSVIHFLALDEYKAEDSEQDCQGATGKAHFRDLDLLRLWPAEGDSASPSASPEYHAQNEDVRGVVRLLTRLLKTRPALHVEIGFLNRRWLGGSFQELQSNFGDRIVLRYKSSEDCDWYAIARLGYTLFPETFQSSSTCKHPLHGELNVF
ncbi:hypothetical protein DL93DRAFT_2097664 [Clavulina sp. PMI_390]|nr:hypothetical protein DL93DRAFT_2097664 [Clavulina sp. PMI_390]